MNNIEYEEYHGDLRVKPSQSFQKEFKEDTVKPKICLTKTPSQSTPQPISQSSQSMLQPTSQSSPSTISQPTHKSTSLYENWNSNLRENLIMILCFILISLFGCYLYYLKENSILMDSINNSFGIAEEQKSNDTNNNYYTNYSDIETTLQNNVKEYLKENYPNEYVNISCFSSVRYNEKLNVYSLDVYLSGSLGLPYNYTFYFDTDYNLLCNDLENL